MGEIDYKKKYKHINIMFYSLIIIIIFAWGINLYNNQGWTKGEEECLNWGIYDEQNFENGVYCIMEDCTIPTIDNNLNTLTRNCICPRNDATVKEYCSMKAKVKKFKEGYEPTTQKVNEEVAKLEKQYNTSLKDLYIKEV